MDYLLWITNLAIAVATGVLAMYAVLQTRASRIAAQAAKASADAAKMSAEAARQALILTHRPRLLVWPIEVEGFDRRRIGDRLINGRVFVTNIGVLTATIQKFWAEWNFWDLMPPDNPAHRVDQGVASVECPPGHYVTFSLPEYEVPVNVFMAINNSAEAAEGQFAGSSRSLTQPPPGKLYLVGCVKYRDEIGLRRQYFAYSWEPSQGRFKAVKHPSYNYEK